VVKNGISEPPEAGRLVDPKTYKQWYENLLKKSGVPFYPFAI
jgi:ubiquinol-cytochrome c reductase cytochrome b subunit